MSGNSIHGVVKEGVVVLDEAIPDGTDVQVVIEQSKESNGKESLGELLLRYSGTVHDLPEDFAENHDHYIYGTPKHE